MSKEFLLFEKDEIRFSSKFMRLQDLLVLNKSSSRMECFILFGIFYLQILSGFFSTNIGILNIDNSYSDTYLNYFQKIIRIKDLLIDNYSAFKVSLILILSFLILSTLYYIWILSKITKFSFYTYKEFLINFILKIFLFVAFNPILDLCLANICFETNNPNFKGISCQIPDNPEPFIIAIIVFIYSIILCFFVNIFYNDSQFLSNSFYSRMNCGYEFYIALNNIVYSILLSQSKYLGKEIFLIYNLIVSLISVKFYFSKYLYYDPVTNTIVGLFHIFYVWTSIFFLIFAYVKINEKGILYIIGIIMISYLYFNLREKLENHIVMKTPFHKITNKYYIQFYLRTLMQKIHNLDSNIEDKAQMIGIIQTHVTECPNPDCLSKKKDKKIYLPITDEWTQRDKPEIKDKVYLLNFLIIVMNYFISQNYYSADMLINRSLYYLTILGNYCQAMFYYKKVEEMKLTMQENFSFIRLHYQISKALVEKLKPSSEGCHSLEDLNTTLYFKYEDLSQKFFDEISNDINLSLEFWKSFKQYNETSRAIDFNKIFHLTDKIRITKNKIEKIWGDLFSTYSGVNDLFDLYENYIEQINDDDLLKRELDTLRNKNINSTEHIQLNFYNILFNKETGIIIANGDKGKEGIIEKTNDEIERIFDYKADELKGMNISYLMPRIFERYHKTFMERYFEVGEKRIIDRTFKTFAKDRENSLLAVTNYIKLFPILTDYIYFVALIIKENLDDVIFVDSKFNIQGISKKLMDKFEITNKNLFQDCNIPFYIICKKFINFYKIFIRERQKKHNKKDVSNSNNNTSMNPSYPNMNNLISNISTPNINSNISGNNNLNYLDIDNNPDKLNSIIVEMQIQDNIEINESTELEYEIRIPQFLHDYVSTINRKETKSEFRYHRTNSIENFENREIETINDQFEENDNLVDDGNFLNQNTLGNPTNNGNSRNNNLNMQRLNFNKQTDENKEFQSKINQYRSLFETARFSELEELIEKVNSETITKEYKINFTFSVYRFGDNQVAYVIRCIDNKSEFDYGASSSGTGNNLNNNPNEKNFTQNHLKAKQLALKDINEVTNEEKKEILEKSNEYLKLCLEEKNFFKIQVFFKEEIANHSKIFGLKKEEHRKLYCLSSF